MLPDARRVRLWDARTGWLRAELARHRNGVFGVVYSPDGKSLASLSAQPQAWRPNTACEVKIWDPATGKERFTLAQHRVGSVSGLLFAPDSRHFVTWAQRDPVLRVWRTSDGAPVGELRGHAKAVAKAVFAPGGKRLAASGMDGTVRQWDFPPAGASMRKKPQP
jgi:WD40 repeat protein